MSENLQKLFEKDTFFLFHSFQNFTGDEFAQSAATQHCKMEDSMIDSRPLKARQSSSSFRRRAIAGVRNNQKNNDYLHVNHHNYNQPIMPRK